MVPVRAVTPATTTWPVIEPVVAGVSPIDALVELFDGLGSLSTPDIATPIKPTGAALTVTLTEMVSLAADASVLVVRHCTAGAASVQPDPGARVTPAGSVNTTSVNAVASFGPTLRTTADTRAVWPASTDAGVTVIVSTARSTSLAAATRAGVRSTAGLNRPTATNNDNATRFMMFSPAERCPAPEHFWQKSCHKSAL